MSKKLETIKAKIAEAEAAKAEDKPEDEKDKPEETPADPAPAPAAPEDKPEDEKDKPEEGKKADNQAIAYLARELAAAKAGNESVSRELAAVRAELAEAKATNEKLARALADPSYAAAAMKPAKIAASDAADGRLTPEAANAAYAKLETSAERAAFRRDHAVELGLR